MLIFENSSGDYLAKVADFGFSTHFESEQDLIIMPKSVPWNAPEHHHRYFSSRDAKAMDVYSFSMLCLWLLFGVNTSDIMPHPSEVIIDDSQALCFQAQGWPEKKDLLLSWKMDKDDRLLEWAHWLVADHGRFAIETEKNLIQFFQRSLCFDYQARTTDWVRLLRLLVPER